MKEIAKMKWCPTCSRRKDASLFVKTGKGMDRCKDCLEKRNAVNAKIKESKNAVEPKV